MSKPQPSYDARKRAVEKLTERLVRHGNVPRDKAEKLAQETARKTDKGDRT